MQKTILLTGATDGIGFETAKILASQGHNILLHGRSPTKLEDVESSLSALSGDGRIESYLADLTRMPDVEKMATAVAERHTKLDVLINNAGIFRTANPVMQDGLDIRFVVNTFAPYLLTKRLLPLMDSSGRVVNLSSAAQAPVDLEALAGDIRITEHFTAYAQSKLAITMWSREMALALKDKGPAIIAVNPGSMLATKMVKEGFGVAGNDIRIGANILIRAALDDEFSTASGKYFDNDSGVFAPPHPDALDTQKSGEVVKAIEHVLERLS